MHISKYLILLGVILLPSWLAGCTDMFSALAANVTYSPPATNAPLAKKAVYLSASDERPTHFVAINTGVSIPVISQVDITIQQNGILAPAKGTEKLVEPHRAAELAMAARLNSLGHPVFADKGKLEKAAQRLVLYLYSFEVDFSEKAFAIANITLAVGKVPPGANYKNGDAVTPKRPEPDPTGKSTPPVYAPICARSIGMGTLQLKSSSVQDAGEALSKAMERAISRLDLRDCL